MSDFLTSSDPVTVHDFKPGRVQAATARFNEWCGRLATLTADIMEQDAMANGGIGSERWLTLKNIMDALLNHQPAAAFQIAQENSLEIHQLEQLAAEDRPLEWGDKADQNMMAYPHQN